MSNINHKHMNIFIHVPKTAGSSMESYEYVGGMGHNNLYITSKMKDYDDSYFKWAFVRNPYVRLASAYFYIKSGQSNTPVIDPDCNFESFIGKLELNLTEDPFNEKIDSNFFFTHISPMSYFIKGETKLDFIGRYENLQEDWKHVLRMINVDYERLKLIGATKLKPANYMDLYTQEMKDKVYSIYREDFEMFGYIK